MDLLSPWSRESIKGQCCQTLRGKCVCTCVFMFVHACMCGCVWLCVLVCYGQILKYSDRWVIECFHFPPATTRHSHTNTCAAHTHTHTVVDEERKRESCCFLKDAAPACMLKLALNVWITHGSSHRGFSSHSLESRGCVDVSIYAHAHTCTHTHKHTHKTSPHTDHKHKSLKYYSIHSVNTWQHNLSFIQCGLKMEGC